MFGYDPYAGMSDFQKRDMLSRMSGSFAAGVMCGFCLGMLAILLFLHLAGKV